MSLLINHAQALRAAVRYTLDDAPGFEIQLDGRDVPGNRALETIFQLATDAICQILEGQFLVSAQGVDDGSPNGIVLALVDVDRS